MQKIIQGLRARIEFYGEKGCYCGKRCSGLRPGHENPHECFFQGTLREENGKIVRPAACAENLANDTMIAVKKGAPAPSSRQI